MRVIQIKMTIQLKKKKKNPIKKKKESQQKPLESKFIEISDDSGKQEPSYVIQHHI